MDKQKRQVRIQQKTRHLKRQVTLRKLFRIDGDKAIREPHRLAEKSALRCSNSNCVMCGNPRKFWKEPTVAEMSFEQTQNWYEP